MGRKSQNPDAGPHGLLIADKRPGMSSHGVVGRARRAFNTRKVGHAGTLDPMATGVLVLGIGKGTKLIHYLGGADKTYSATIRLGQATVTDDRLGEASFWGKSADVLALTDADVQAALVPLTGEIQQRPSTFSAIKIDGKRAYARARAGESVEIAERPVTVSEFTAGGLQDAVAPEVLDLSDTAEGLTTANPDVVAPAADAVVRDVDVTVSCSSGTYIRALARDLGESLGVGGHLTMLRRSHVGPFDLADCPEWLDESGEFEQAPVMLSMAEAAARILPSAQITAEDRAALGFGKELRKTTEEWTVDGELGPAGSGRNPALVALLCPAGELVAIVESRAKTGYVSLKPSTVFHPTGTNG